MENNKIIIIFGIFAIIFGVTVSVVYAAENIDIDGICIDVPPIKWENKTNTLEGSISLSFTNCNQEDIIEQDEEITVNVTNTSYIQIETPEYGTIYIKKQNE